MTSLKAKHPHLKVLLAMGGWAEKMDKNYSEVVESPSRRRDLVSSISEFLRYVLTVW
jgi:GH18 family chitinase